MSDDARKYVPAEVAAPMLGKAPQTLSNERTKGVGLPYHKVGRRVLYALDDIEAAIQAGRVEPKNKR